jgi:hypothetical protein
MNRFRNWFGRANATDSRPARRPRLMVEELEQRQVPTVSYHGGALLRHVEVQPVFLGSDWFSAPNSQSAGQLQGFLNYVTNSPYMDMLTAAGYAVGRGSTSPGVTAGYTFDKTRYLTDAAIQADLQALVYYRYLPANDANRLYVLFVEPGVAVWAGDHTLGYHSAVNGMAYAVVPYPGGINFTEASGLTAFANLTAVTSHELAEAVTDPLTYFNPYTRSYYSWFDDSYGYYNNGEGEIGDVVNLSQRYPFVLLNNFAVQEVAGTNDQPLSPAGSVLLAIPEGVTQSSVAMSVPGHDLSPASRQTEAHAQPAPAGTESAPQVTAPLAPAAGGHGGRIRHLRDQVFAEGPFDWA